MERLTDNDLAFCIENDCFMEVSMDELREKLSKEPTYEELYAKLNKYEQLEQELGCPLDVREQAFKKGFYDINGNYFTCEHYVPFLKQMHTNGIMRGEEKRFKLEDYKKTWWLKKDKSE